jgi:hypothetical protein
MRIVAKLDGIDYSSKTRATFKDASENFLNRGLPISYIHVKYFNKFLNSNEVNLAKFKINVNMTH